MDELQSTTVSRSHATEVLSVLLMLDMWFRAEADGDTVTISVKKAVVENLNNLIRDLKKE